MGILDRLNNEEKENVSITLDKKVVDKLKDLRNKKKVKKISPVINELIKDWLNSEELKNKKEGENGNEHR